MKRFFCILVVLTMLFSISAVTVTAKGGFEVKGLQTEYLTNPIGVDEQKPRFSWYSEASYRGMKQKNYRITMSSSLEKLKSGDYDIWDTKTVESDVSTGITYNGKNLPAKTRIYWQVTVTDEESNAVTSAPAYFETGLMDTGWQGAKWITAPATTNGDGNDTATITIDVKIINTAAGFFFGATDANNFYMWQLKEAGGKVILVPHKKENGTWGYLHGDGISLGDVSAIKDEFATLKIEINGDYAITYFNGEKVCETEFGTTVPLGKVGFRQAGTEEAEYDNLRIVDGDGNVLFETGFSKAEKNPFKSGTITENGTLITKNDGFNTITQMANVSSDIADENRPANSSTGDPNGPAPMYRKEFSVESNVKSARLYITSAGCYDAYINGKPVTNSVLNPGRSDYNVDLKYQTFDVTELLLNGKNAIGIYNGHGWFNTKWNNFGTVFGIMALLEIECANGKTIKVVTDESWKSYTDGPIRYEDIMNGFSYDATKEQDGWSEEGFDDSDWQNTVTTTAEILKVSTPVWTRTGLITAGDVFESVKTLKPQANTLTYDFGVNLAGTVYVKVKGEKGQKIKFTYGEIVNNMSLENMTGMPGTVYRGNLTDAQATDFYTLNGDPDGEIFYPNMTYHGFRYMQVEGVNFALTEENIISAEAHALYTDLDRTGYFETSDKLVNQLYENSYRSNVGNFMGIPTDCPQRGERAGWTADAQVYARTASFNLNTFAFLEEYATNLTRNMSTNNTYPEVSPAPTWKTTGVENGWGDAGVIIPWTMYLVYGDTEILKDNYDGMKKWVDAVVKSSDNYERPNKARYGDWLAVETTPANVTNNAYSAYTTGLVAKIARVLGYEDDAKRFEEISEKFRQSFVRVCTDGNGTTLSNTQTSYVLGLAFNLFDEEDKETAQKNLAKLLEDNGYKLKTGFLGINFLNPVLSDMGCSDIAYKLLLQKQYPSWLYPVTLGATTVFEKWNGLMGVNEDYITSTTASLNHYAYGSVAEWMYRYMLGIDLDEQNPGYKHIILHPETDFSLDYARGSYLSQYGKIESGWKFENGNTVYEITVPANTTATLTLAKSATLEILEGGLSADKAEGVTRLENADEDAVFELVSGSYKFTVVGNGKIVEPTETSEITSTPTESTATTPNPQPSSKFPVGAFVAIGAAVVAAIGAVVVALKNCKKK